MKIPDVNVLINLAHGGAAQHQRAADWMADASEQPAGVGFSWLAQPGAQVVHPGPRYAGLLGRLLLTAGTAGNLTTDAQLAAIAVEHGATVGSSDRDFRRFAGLSLDCLTN